MRRKVFLSIVFTALHRQTGNNHSMKEESVRTTVDIPRPLYRKVKQQAVAKSCSVRELVLSGSRPFFCGARGHVRKGYDSHLIVSEGPKVNERIYEHLEFP